MNKIAMALVLGSMFAVGCGDKAADGKDSKSASASSSGDAKGASGDKIGVKECDDYIEAYSKCIDKMPDAAKEPSKKGLEDMKKAWSEAAKAGGPTKDALATGCKSAADAMAANPACK